MAKKRTEKKTKTFSEAIGLQYIFNNTITDFFIGLALVVIAVVIIIAMISFLNTGANDQSLLENLKPGDRVYVISFDQNGEVLTAPDKNKEVMVQMGIMKMKVPMAELMPSKELALIKPAASPMRKIPFSPLQKSRKDAGRSTRHASVFKGAPKRNPISSSFAFCRSKRSLA